MNKNIDIELIIISGRSGSGKSAALHMLEDDGYYAIDNFPGQLLTQFIDIIKTPPHKKNISKSSDMY
jgi:RNase adapter protein RapZ